jgi:hypothetical protein
MKDDYNQFLEAHLKKLDAMCCKYRRIKDHPDAILLNEAVESLEAKGQLPNLLDPSLTKQS